MIDLKKLETRIVEPAKTLTNYHYLDFCIFLSLYSLKLAL